MTDKAKATKVHVIGAGLAGCEATWTLARSGVPVNLYEMRPNKMTQAHKTAQFAELVCSNSLRCDDAGFNAVGVMHQELRLAGSLIMQAGDRARIPAGGALAVDRHQFSAIITDVLRNQPGINIINREVSDLSEFGDDLVIIATGPLTASGLANSIADLSGDENLAFFDAISPIIYYDSIDMSVCWRQSRYDKSSSAGDNDGKGDYLNCPLNKHQYETFVRALIDGEKTSFKQWEKDTKHFEACLPIEVMAERGLDTLRFGPMKPVGLTSPYGHDLHAVVQLRQDNNAASLWNMVGFQTKLKQKEQARIFKTIPGLEQANFARFGGVHRNMFVNSPQILTTDLRFKTRSNLRLAGQITGCEGYVESTAIGFIAGLCAAYEFYGQKAVLPPPTSAVGALLNYVTGSGGGDNDKLSSPHDFQPMNVNFGLMPQLTSDDIHQFTPSAMDCQHLLRGGRITKKQKRKYMMAQRALTTSKQWLENLQVLDNSQLYKLSDQGSQLKELTG